MARDPEPVRVHGLFGECCYTREGGLCVPFQGSATFKLKDDLKALGFVCHYDDKVWELPEQQYSEKKEQQLRYLLQEGELPLDSEEGEEDEGEDAAAAEVATAAAGAVAGAARAAVPPTPEGGRKRQREREPEERRFLGGAVVMRREADGHLLLQGAPLLHIEPMLRRIFHFNRLPAQPAAGGAAAAAAGPGPAAAAAAASGGGGAAAAAAHAHPQHRWRSSFVLTDAEAQFVGDVVEHRRPRLLQGRGLDDKEPIPPGAAIPARFRPHTPDGAPLRGPYKVRNGEGHNIGRQFFSTFRQGQGQFLWADGTEAFSAEAFARNAAWAEDEGILRPGMGAYAQLVQGLLGGAAAAALAAGGWGDEDGWDEEDWDAEDWDEEDEEASGLGKEEEEEGSEQEDASSGGE